VQRLHNLEEAEAKYLDVLRKARPDLAEASQVTVKEREVPYKEGVAPQADKSR
jgi:hypothetical protein